MQEYKEFRPTEFDCKGYMLHDQQNWLVLPTMQTRDSGILDQSNFAVALEMLGGESENVEVHRFGHWGPGWFEIIIVNPADTEKVKIAQDIENNLADYPVLSDDDHSRREYEAMADTWSNASLSDKIYYCQRAGISFLKARQEGIPEGIYTEHLGIS